MTRQSPPRRVRRVLLLVARKVCLRFRKFILLMFQSSENVATRTLTHRENRGKGGSVEQLAKLSGAIRPDLDEHGNPKKKSNALNIPTSESINPMAPLPSKRGKNVSYLPLFSLMLTYCSRQSGRQTQISNKLRLSPLRSWFLLELNQLWDRFLSL